MMKRDIAIIGAGIVAVAAALVVGPAPAPPPMAARAQALTDILERIRQDVGFYEVQAARWRGDIPNETIPDPADIIPAHDDPPDAAHPQGQHWEERKVDKVCPVTQYDFDIVKIEVTLQVVSSNNATGQVGLKIPFLGADLTGGGAASLGRISTKTLVLDRTVPYDVATLAKYFGTTDYETLARGRLQDQAARATPTSGPPPTTVFPVSDTLIALRQTLVQASEKLPCFDLDAHAPANDSIKLDFQVQMSADPNIGFTFLVFSASADNKIQKSTENTMVVTFAPHNARGG